MDIKQVDSLALDCIITLKMHDMLGKLMEGEDIGNSDTARVIKDIHNQVGRGVDAFHAKILKHAVMLGYQLKHLSKEYEFLSHIKVDNDEEIAQDLVAMGLKLSLFDYDDEKSADNMEEEFISWLAKLAAKNKRGG